MNKPANNGTQHGKHSRRGMIGVVYPGESMIAAMARHKAEFGRVPLVWGAPS